MSILTLLCSSTYTRQTSPTLSSLHFRWEREREQTTRLSKTIWYLRNGIYDSICTGGLVQLVNRGRFSANLYWVSCGILSEIIWISLCSGLSRPNHRGGSNHLLFRAAAAKISAISYPSILDVLASKLYLTLVRSLHMNSTVQLSIVGDLPQIYFLWVVILWSSCYDDFCNLVSLYLYILDVQASTKGGY